MHDLQQAMARFVAAIILLGMAGLVFAVALVFLLFGLFVLVEDYWGRAAAAAVVAAVCLFAALILSGIALVLMRKRQSSATRARGGDRPGSAREFDENDLGAWVRSRPREAVFTAVAVGWVYAQAPGFRPIIERMAASGVFSTRRPGDRIDP